MPTGDTATLGIHELSVRYGDLLAVDRVSLTARRDEITALVGPSGCGKTSLLRAIAGFETPSTGSIRICGHPVASAEAWVAPERRSVGMVFQQGALFPHLNVSQNVGFGLKGDAQAEEKGRLALQTVGLSGLGRRFPDELSGGQQQRVALARALAPAPDIVLLDEPFASLDATLRQRVREEVCAILRRAGTIVVIVTHDQDEALSIADQLAVMQDGRILQTGPPQEIYERPLTAAVAEFIGDGQLVGCGVEGGVLQSDLGQAECDSLNGAGLLLVRPEDLILEPEGLGRGVPGEVLDSRFFGHDQLSRVRLRSGRSLLVRLAGSDVFPAGTAVRLRLRPKRYLVYGADDDLGHALPVDRTA